MTPILIFASCIARAQGYGLSPRGAKLAAVLAAIGRRPLTGGRWGLA